MPKLPDVAGIAPSQLLVDAKAACPMLSMGRRTLWLLTNRKAVPSIRIGRAVRYSPVELSAWVSMGCPTDAGAADRVRKAVRQ
jgi:predicted DNA-binding transcriptional regulator AlpA